MQRFICIHETPEFCYCVDEFDFASMGVPEQSKDTMAKAKKAGVKVYKIAKANSRFAKPTEQEAYSRLLYLKRRQLKHLTRELAFLKAFLDFDADKLEKLDSDVPFHYTVPGTSELVNGLVLFN